MKLFKKFNLKGRVECPWYKTYEELNIVKNVKIYKGSMYDRVVDASKKFPDEIAISYFGRNITYTKFISKIETCAKALKYQGINEGDVVSICSPNLPEAVIALYAANKIGAIANMIHPLSSENELKHYFEISKTNFLFIVDLAAPKVKNIIKGTSIKKVVLLKVSESMNSLTTFVFWLTKGRKIDKIELEENHMYYDKFIQLSKGYTEETYCKRKSIDPAVILYSGGTTGKSKGILHSNLSFNTLADEQLAMCPNLKEKMSVLSIMPIFHGFGLLTTLHTGFVLGGKCILLPTFSPRKFGDLIKKYSPNVIAGVPTLYETLTHSKAVKNMDLSFIKCAVSGGDTVSESLRQKVDDFFVEHNSTAKLTISYGMTESLSGVTIMPYVSKFRKGVGLPCPGVHIKIVKPSTNTELPYKEEGEICISSPSVMMEYIDDPKETSNTLRLHEDGRVWLHSGDLGSMDEKGYVYFEQRLKRMIISSGYNIYPNQIENVIEKHPDVISCTVIGIPHPYKVQVAKAYIVLREGVKQTPNIKNEIKELVKDNIASYAYPYEYEFKASLPMTKLGKIAYQELEKENNEGKL
ncbi:MAG: class I adenylate-forming enzyme family protein [Bacilli bacterium]